MSRSNKDRYEKPVKPVKKHVKRVLCDGCGEWYPEDEVSVEVDAVTAKVVGRFCGDCV
jgi:hypothetical protein